MNVELHHISIRDIVKGFVDNDTEGCKGFGGALDIRPKYQRNFVYDDKKREAVIHSVRHKFPLSVMYWVKKGTGTTDDPYRYEVLDGQQRTISICQFYDKAFPVKSDRGNFQFFHNLTDEQQREFLDYELMVYICEGTEEEELQWFQVINIAGEALSRQELRNAIYSGKWLTSAKEYFSKPGSGGQKIGDDYMSCQWKRQEGLEMAIDWVSHGNIERYMSEHQHDENAEELWKKWKAIIDWVKKVFPTYRKEMKKVPWGKLYDQYGAKFGANDAARLEKEVARLMADDEVSKKAGIYSYVLGEPERVLSLRQFTANQKREAYERQHHRCPMCEADGVMTEYDLKDMEADHIVPWSKGGATTPDNLQMLCHDHNNAKSNKSNAPAQQRTRSLDAPVDPLAGNAAVDAVKM